MKKNISNLLKSSLEQERKSVKDKTTSNINDRFIKADILFDKHSAVEEYKTNVIRDTFTLPEKDYRLIESCKIKLLENKISATKSEIIRAGLILLSNLSNEELTTSYKLVEKIKTGRPKHS